MSNNEHNDFMEVDSVSDKDKNPKENVEKIVAEAVDSDAEKKADIIDENGAKSEDKEEDYEQICYMCHRPEHIAGKMIKIPGDICICSDCMQRTFDAMNSTPFPMGDFPGVNLGTIPNISMINLSDLQGGVPKNQRLKKKKEKEKKEPAVLDIHSIPAPHKIKASLDEYVVGQ